MKPLFILVVLAATAHADDVADLADARQATRDAAAKHLRDSHAHAEHDTAYWTKRLAPFKVGSPLADFERRLAPTSEGGGSSGHTSDVIYRLDDYTTVQVSWSIDTKQIVFVGKVEEQPRSIWVDPPKDFTGHWVTYFVNGTLERDYRYDHGAYAVTSDYFANGQLVMTRHYVKGTLEGPEVGFHENGKKAYEGVYRSNKLDGHWVYWFPDGKVETDATYVAGQLHGTSTRYSATGEKVILEYDHGAETGRASWDAHGVFESAHGTAAAHYKNPR